MLAIKPSRRSEKEEKKREKCSEKYFANSKQKFQNICLKFFVLCDSIAQEKNESILTQKSVKSSF